MFKSLSNQGVLITQSSALHHAAGTFRCCKLSSSCSKMWRVSSCCRLPSGQRTALLTSGQLQCTATFWCVAFRTLVCFHWRAQEAWNRTSQKLARDSISPVWTALSPGLALCFEAFPTDWLYLPAVSYRFSSKHADECAVAASYHVVDCGVYVFLGTHLRTLHLAVVDQ